MHALSLSVFWTSLGIILYVYFGYPFLLWSGLLGARKDTPREQQLLPVISVIVAAHNEEAAIARKLDNLLALDYPADKLEILVGSDGSNDHTAEIASRYASAGVRIAAREEHHGKSSIQNELVAKSHGSILVFTDADTSLSHRALREIVENFSDAQVGLVTAVPTYVNANETGVVRNEGLYLRYETWLRTQESHRGLLAMASGALFAFRRSLWKCLDPSEGDDFVIPLRVALQKASCVLDSRPKATTQLSQKGLKQMFCMKMRIISKDLRGLIANLSVLNPFKTGGVAISLISHKLLRWLVPYFLATMFAANCFLLDHEFYRLFFGVQVLLYGTALLAWRSDYAREKLIPSIVLSFCLVNLASLVGTLHCLSGRTTGRWNTVR